MSNLTPSLRNWYQLSPREQAVWGAAYASAPQPGIDAARHADEVIASLAQVEWPEREAPEHRAARLVGWLTLEQFRGWYLVELQLNQPGKPPLVVSEAQIHEAYQTYAMCTSDYH